MSVILTDSQHDHLMRYYQDLRLRATLEARSHREEVYDSIPELSDLDRQITDVSIKSLKRVDGADPSTLSERISAIKAQKIALIEKAGFPSDYLDIHYSCNLCGDTGFVDDKACSCFKHKVIEIIYSDRRWQNMFQRENFDTFDISYYDDTTINPSTDLTPRSAALLALEKAHEYTDTLLRDGYSNLLITGSTGTGKTFLSNCIARELIEAGLYVVYLTAPGLVELFERASNYKRPGTRDFSNDAYDFSYSSVYDCDLLIIDDLGAEFSNSFTTARIFDLLNRRLLSSRSTLISTNLNLQGIKDMYSERLTSRIIGSYSMVYLYGDDIRLKRRMLNNMPA